MTTTSIEPTADPSNDHLMVDMETMGTGTDCAILSIGAVIFNPYIISTPDDLRKRSYYATVGLEDNVRQGRVMDASTVVWWLQQSEGARKALFENNVTLLNALDGLRLFAIENPPPKFVWAKGPTFDIAILRAAFKQARLMWPFHFARERCVRTAEDMGFPNGDDIPAFRIGDHHNALDDAITQALVVQMAFRNLGLASAQNAANGFIARTE